MKNLKTLLLLAALPAFYGCASFNHGDILVERSAARAMLEDTSIKPFAEVNVSWKNFPYRSASDAIGEGSVSKPKKPKPVPVPPEDGADFTRRARDVFSRAGLYDPLKGEGTLTLEMTTFGRWTYRELLRSYLVDTSFIFILPSSLRVNYYLTADFQGSTATVALATEATNKTTFHLLLAPLYPFTAPGGRENKLLRQMLWRTATDVYAKIKSAGRAAPAARPLPPPDTASRAASQAEEEKAEPVPPMEPSRDWNEEPPDD
ncbi:MAG: hypothetical protein ACYC2I_07200 [Elusimicrobiales bacterium]